MTLSTAAPARVPSSDGNPAAPLSAEPRWRRVVRTGGLWGIGAVPVAVLVVLFCYPVVVMISLGFAGEGPSIGQVLTRPRITRVLWFTVWQAAASAALCLIIGLPVAHLLYRRRFRGRAVVRALVTVPFVLPTVVIALAFRTLVASNGLLGGLGLDGSVLVILAAHLCLNLAVVVRTVGVAWAGLDDRPLEAARSLGAGPWRAFRTITLPALGPSLAAAGVMVFLFCATSFGVILLLGGSRYSTIETEIYRQTVDLLDLRTASVLSVLQLLLVTAVLIVAGRLRRRTETMVRTRSVAVPRWSRRDVPVTVVAAIAAVVVVGPLVVMAVRSLRGSQGWTLDHYRALSGLGEGNLLLVPVTSALGHSLRSALLAAGVALLLGVMLTVVLARRPRRPAARRALSGLDAVVMLPLGVSAVTLGFGFLVALDEPPLDLRSSALIVPLAQALVAMPLVVRMLVPVARATDDRLRQAAAVLGAPPPTVWRTVDLPLLGRAVAGAAGFAFAVALGEFGATSFLARPQDPTLPVVIGRLISRPGELNTGMALASATVLALLCLVVVSAMDLVAGRKDTVGGVGGF